MEIQRPSSPTNENLNPSLTLYTKINSKWVINVKRKTNITFRKNIGENLPDLG